MKKFIAGILMGALALSFSACNHSLPEDSLTYETKASSTSSTSESTSSTTESTSSTTESSSSSLQVQPEKPIAPSGWEYPAIDLSEGKYTAEKLDFDACARNFGYKVGTYEYEYFRALSGISFYARIASKHVSSVVKNYAVSDLAEGFYKTVSKETFIAPYENILFHTFSLLKNRDFTLFPKDDALINQYQNTLSYLLDKPVEVWYPSALSFTDIDTKLTEYALDLLSLKEKYPDYTGEFTLSEEAISHTQAIAESCKAVAENRAKQWEAWENYFKEATPKATALAELIPEKDTVKITFTSDHPLSVYIDPKYIVDFKGEVIQNGNAVGYLYEPMESPVVCYVPIDLFYKKQGVFQIAKYASLKPIKSYKEKFKVDFDVSACYSDVPITVSNPFLDAALKKEFGGSYSERDLSQIGYVQIAYHPTMDNGGIDLLEPYIIFTYHNIERGVYRGSSSYAYSDFFEEDWVGDFPMELLNDMEYFPLLKSVKFHQSGQDHNVPFPEGYLERILAKEYTAEDFEP